MYPVFEKPLKIKRCMADSHYYNKKTNILNISRVSSDCKKYIKNNKLNIERSKSNPI